MPRQYISDVDAWTTHPEDRWVYNRLQLAERLGYPCGPAGLPFPSSGEWWAKPVINLTGMAKGSHAVSRIEDVRPGEFWMPRFVGPQYSVDYVREGTTWRQISALQMIPREDGRPLVWIRVTNTPDLPALFDTLQHTAFLNVEYIGPHAIEAHLRHGYDFVPDQEALAAVVVWEDRPVLPPGGVGFVPDEAVSDDGLTRLGFYYLK